MKRCMHRKCGPIFHMSSEDRCRCGAGRQGCAAGESAPAGHRTRSCISFARWPEPASGFWMSLDPGSIIANDAKLQVEEGRRSRRWRGVLIRRASNPAASRR